MISRFTQTYKITPSLITKFASIVGDTNPVHVDPIYASKTRFKTPIAHGMTSIVFLQELLPKKYRISSFEVKFMKPIYPGYQLETELVVEEMAEKFLMVVKRGEENITEVRGKVELI